jgi:hypothetical protein
MGPRQTGWRCRREAAAPIRRFESRLFGMWITIPFKKLNPAAVTLRVFMNPALSLGVCLVQSVCRHRLFVIAVRGGQ